MATSTRSLASALLELVYNRAIIGTVYVRLETPDFQYHCAPPTTRPGFTNCPANVVRGEGHAVVRRGFTNRAANGLRGEDHAVVAEALLVL